MFEVIYYFPNLLQKLRPELWRSLKHSQMGGKQEEARWHKEGLWCRLRTKEKVSGTMSQVRRGWLKVSCQSVLPGVDHIAMTVSSWPLEKVSEACTHICLFYIFSCFSFKSIIISKEEKRKTWQGWTKWKSITIEIIQSP